MDYYRDVYEEMKAYKSEKLKQQENIFRIGFIIMAVVVGLLIWCL